MSEMVGAIRSNVFRVKDAAAFGDWLKTYSFGEDTEVWNEEQHPDEPLARW